MNVQSASNNRKERSVMSNKAIYTAAAPSAIGPYSQGISAREYAFISGQLPIDPATGAFPSEDIAAQTRQSLLNLKAIIEANGMTMADVDHRATGRHQRVRCHERSVRRIFCRALSGPRSLSGSSTSKECKGRDRSRRRQTLTDRFDERQPNGALHPRCVLSNRQNNRFIIVLGSGFFPTPVFV